MAKSLNSGEVFNIINSLYYSKVKTAFDSGGPANFFTHLEPINFAIFKKIENEIKTNPIRLKELSSGGSSRRWETLKEFDSKRKWEVTLTDFSTDFLPELNHLENDFLKFSCEELNLLKPFGNDKVFDLFLITYGFDSVWFPQDLHLEKVNGLWYKSIYDFGFRIYELENKKELQEKDFEDIKITRRLKKADLKEVKYGEFIEKRYGHLENVKVNFPGGLIAKVKEAFETQLKNSGIFIVGDIAVDNKDGIIKSDNPNYPDIVMDESITVGKVARAKVEDYGLAKDILDSEGFKVELRNVMDFVEEMGEITPINVTDHLIMVVKNS